LQSGGEKSQILLIFGLWHFVMLPIGGIAKKLNMGAQLQTFLYQTA